MAENREARALFDDALSGRINRRELFRRGAALGIGTTVLAALSQETIRGALAQEERDIIWTVYQWQFDLHPQLLTSLETLGVKIDIAPATGFSFEPFVVEAQAQNSTWDVYTGVTPFLEMQPLVETGAIEPWNPYLPAGAAEDLIAATREEGMWQGPNDTEPQLYVWPLLLDVCSLSWHAGIFEKAGLDPEKAPANWDEFIAAAKTIKESKAALYGAIFDFHDWRSLIPVTHSISTDVYTPEGLFRYTSDPAIQALEILKQIMPYSSKDILFEGSTDSGVNNTPDEQIFSVEQAGLYFKYQNAPMRFAALWPDPSQLRLGALPVAVGGVGGTVFWDTGAVLFKYGQNKQKSGEFLLNLSKDVAIWEESIAGNADAGIPAVGQLPVLESLWAEWATTPPDFLTANPWALEIKNGLDKAKAIAPSVLSVTQFSVARPEWVKYLTGDEADAKTAMQKAQDAVAAEYKKATGNDPSY